MPLITCPDCQKEISDAAPACPNCGRPLAVENGSSPPQQVEIIGVQIKSKRGRTVFIVALLLIGLAVGAYFYINSTNKNEYIDNLVAVKATMSQGMEDAKFLCELTRMVWYNAIYKEDDNITDKYTKETTGSGYYKSTSFVDFNTALANLHKSSLFIVTAEKIEKNQLSTKEIIKKIQEPPAGLEQCYETVSEMYVAYKGVTDLAIAPKGSLQSFAESARTKIENFSEYYEKLDNQLADKLPAQ